MKYAILLVACVLGACATTSSIQVPAGKSVEVIYPDFALYDIDLKNTSTEELNVSMRKGVSGASAGAFGLASKGNATVTMDEGDVIQIANGSDRPVKVKFSIQERDWAEAYDKGTQKTVSFTLRNNSAKSIPLLIPSVMNPNLSPFSNSGVDLVVGQEILFRQGGKKHVLLTVDASLQGQKVDVSKLLKERKEELGLN